MIEDKAASNDNFCNLEVEELALARSKNSSENKLAFAVMLKFLQTEGRYPTNTDFIHQSMITSLALQLDVIDGDTITLSNYNWSSRTAKRFRQEIRHLLGYRRPTVADGKKLICWLVQTVLPQAPTLAQCQSQAQQFYRQHKLEPVKSGQLDRYISSAHYQFEQQFFSIVFSQLTVKAIDSIKALLNEVGEDIKIATEKVNISNDAADQEREEIASLDQIQLKHLKKGMAGVKLKHVNFEIDKLKRIAAISLPTEVFEANSRKLLQKYYSRIMAELPSEIKDHSDQILYATMASFCYIRSQLQTDNLADLFIQLIHKMRTSAETFINKEIISEIKCVNGKFDILYSMAHIAVENPEGIIQDKIYPEVSKETLQDLTNELQYKGKWYETKVQTKMRSLYSHAHRPVLLTLLEAFVFHEHNTSCKGLLSAIAFIKQNQNIVGQHYPDAKTVPMDVIPHEWRSIVIESTQVGPKVNRMNYEMAILEQVRKHLRCKSVWIEGAYRYRNPEEDTPKDFDARKEYYYQDLGMPLDGKDFVTTLKKLLDNSLQQLNDTIPNNNMVKILNKKTGGRIKVTPSEPQAEPTNIKALQHTISRRWSIINLIDILKETDLRVGFSKHFHTVASRENISKDQLLKRLLLCLYGIGSNTGLKRISSANADANHSDLRYIKRRFINPANVKCAIAEVVNSILAVRKPRTWGPATTGCACDSTQVSSWDQNLMTEWHVRYNGRGVMIYWHVDKNAACIHSQLKTCSSSEVGAMIKGILNHCTKMDMNQAYVDTHGQSVIGFAFSYLLSFDLLPRLKNINKQKLCYSTAKHKANYPNLTPILRSSINWERIEESYNEVIKHTAALKAGTVEPDVMIKHFSKDNDDNLVYKALIEIGNAVKTIFLCRYLSSEELRIEIHDALNVVERLNSIMSFIFYGKLGEISTNNKEDQELAIACLHLIQVCMVYINTLIIQVVLSDPIWQNKLLPEDKRALTPLIHAHINPYGLFTLDLSKRLIIETLKHQEAA